MCNVELKTFWDNLGSKPPQGQIIKTAEEGGDDKAATRNSLAVG